MNVAAIILAAGEARRYGSAKPLLTWHGQPFVRHIAQTALSAGLSPLVLVSGAYADQITQAVADLPLIIVYNPDWQTGLSSSIKVGLLALPPESEAVIFMLGDQPQIPVELLYALVEKYASTVAPIVVPFIAGRRANPVLFARPTFTDLLKLGGDVGGRALFDRFPLVELIWDDPSLLLDVDTPQDYQRLLAETKNSGMI